MSAKKIIYGFHTITSLIRIDPMSIKEIFIDEYRTDGRVNDLMKLVETNKIKYHLSNKERLDGFVSNHNHQGVVAMIHEVKNKYVTIEDIVETNPSKPLLILILDGIEDPHNLGACFRVADSMGVHAIVSPKDNAVGLNSTVRKDYYPYY